MDCKSESEERGRRPRANRQARPWTDRYTGAIRYRRYTDLDGGGRPSILFKFELPPGQTELPQEVYAILQEMKHMEPRLGHGGKPQRSSLEFTRDTKHGRVWRLNDDPTGRTAADLIDAKLFELAERLDAERQGGPSR